jgi:hypothetical protein
MIATGDLQTAHQYGVSGAAMGASLGAVSGAIGGYMSAQKQGISPWTGKAYNSEMPQQTPYQKGQEGVNRYIQEEVLSNGGSVISREVTLEVGGVRVRVDVAADFNGEIHLIEVKNGPFAGFTQNQSIVYPQMMDGVRVPIVPRGNNALSLTPYGWQIGQSTTQYRLIIIKY